MQTDNFASALQDAGIYPDGQLIEGKITRAACSCSPHKKNRNGNGWYLYHTDTPATITWGCWKEDCQNSTGGSYSPKSERTVSPEEREAIKTRMETTRREREEERQKVEAATRDKAARLWDKGRDVLADHPYIVKKGIKPIGIKQLNDMLMIPMSENGIGTPASLQLIFPDGSKRFLSGTGAIPGPLYHVIRGSGGTLYEVEGYATGLSINAATGASVVVAFSSGRLPAVAEALRSRFPERDIIIAGDYGNGSGKALEAARLIIGKVVIPAMPEGVAGSDWNDIHVAVSLEEVARQLATASPVEAAASVINSGEPRPDHSPQEETPSGSNIESLTGKTPRQFPLKTGRELRALDIKVEWIVDGLIPRHSVVLLYGRGGIGKTTLAMMLANAIDQGVPIFGMTTVETQVIVVDFENSLAVLSERAKRTAVDRVLFWDSGQNPPSLDKAEWGAYLELLEQHPGALFVFDTLRSSHSGDENSSEVMTLIMRRMRQLRDAGATVILLHHTPKGNDRQFKGSGAIFDLCDQTLALYQTAKPDSEQEAADADDDDPDRVYRFGTGKKTRYRPHRIFLTFDAERELFVQAKDPGAEAMEALREIIRQVGEETLATQSKIVEAAVDSSDFNFGGKSKIRELLTRGVDRFWSVEKGLWNATIYRPVQFSSFPDPIGGEKLKNRNQSPDQTGNLEQVDTQQTPINTEFISFSEGVEKTEKQNQLDEIETGNVPLFTEAELAGVLS